MKASRCALAIAVGVSVLALATCAPAKYVPTANEEIYGTWTNPHPSAATPRFEKIVCAPSGYKGYELVTSTTVVQECSWQIASKWKDSQGNIWYKIFRKNIGGTFGNLGYSAAELYKLGNSATVLEKVQRAPSSDEEMKNPVYPTAIDPKDDTYRIYYRAKE